MGQLGRSAEERADGRATPCVIVVGAINVDFVVATETLPGPGETVVGPRLERFGGGKGANAAVAAARAGAAVALVGAVGADDTGDRALAELEGEGVDITGVARLADEATGAAVIVVNRAGENQIAVGAGANAAVTADGVRSALAGRLDHCGCVLVSTEITPDAVVEAVVTATRHGVPCILNPAPVIPAVLDVLDRGAILTPNGGEIVDLLVQLEMSDGRVGNDTVQCATSLAARLASTVVATMGDDGAVVVTATGKVLTVPAPVSQVTDTTGAGDTFNGVLAAGIAAGGDVAAAARRAVIAASLSVSAVGARAGMPHRDELDSAVASGP